MEKGDWFTGPDWLLYETVWNALAKKRMTKKTSGPLTIEEISSAQNLWVRRLTNGRSTRRSTRLRDPGREAGKRRDYRHLLMQGENPGFTASWIRKIRKSESLQDHLAQQEIRWQFNLSKSPWWGGMYERLIKEIKKTLYKTMGRSHLYYDQMEALVMDIERHLNNRSLTYVESHNGEEQVLTPNVIMWGQNSHVVEDCEIEGNEVSKLHARLMMKRQHVWRRWVKEYIHRLLENHRINRGAGNVPEVGEIVLVIGDGKNRGEWIKGKVTHHIKGKDEIKSVEKVQTEEASKDSQQIRAKSTQKAAVDAREKIRLLANEDE
ncbi:uncharacterized protein LOC114526736 [Dendronephthya gigantea]|uniref:uncharacterized protein LOC114526736 n=1 Tax=Dendronephthya gigantea TaxID=151771 RepID=UPI00106C6FE7|nr:uncharacterized protein LOC114526736 [Dendronephthya gigantea]